MSDQTTDNSNAADDLPGPQSRRRSVLIAGFILLAGILSQTYHYFWFDSLLPGDSETQVKKVTTGDGGSEEAVPVKIYAVEDVLGTWMLDGAIRRVIENRADGTAKIDVTFDFVTALRYGSELQLDLEWTLEENVLTHTIVGGSPETGKKRLISDFGNKAYFKILNIDDSEMHLVDFDDPPVEYRWEKVAETGDIAE